MTSSARHTSTAFARERGGRGTAFRMENVRRRAPQAERARGQGVRRREATSDQVCDDGGARFARQAAPLSGAVDRDMSLGTDMERTTARTDRLAIDGRRRSRKARCASCRLRRNSGARARTRREGHYWGADSEEPFPLPMPPGSGANNDSSCWIYVAAAGRADGHRQDAAWRGSVAATASIRARTAPLRGRCDRRDERPDLDGDKRGINPDMGQRHGRPGARAAGTETGGQIRPGPQAPEAVRLGIGRTRGLGWVDLQSQPAGTVTIPGSPDTLDRGLVVTKDTGRNAAEARRRPAVRRRRQPPLAFIERRPTPRDGRIKPTWSSGEWVGSTRSAQDVIAAGSTFTERDGLHVRPGAGTAWRPPHVRGSRLAFRWPRRSRHGLRFLRTQRSSDIQPQHAEPIASGTATRRSRRLRGGGARHRLRRTRRGVHGGRKPACCTTMYRGTIPACPRWTTALHREAGSPLRSSRRPRTTGGTAYSI